MQEKKDGNWLGGQEPAVPIVWPPDCVQLCIASAAVDPYEVITPKCGWGS